MSMENEVFAKIRATLIADTTLMGYLGSDNNKVRYAFGTYPSLGANFAPCITYFTLPYGPDGDMDSLAKYALRVQIDVWDKNTDVGIANIRNINERIDALLYLKVFSTTNYRIGLNRRISKNDVLVDLLDNPNQLIQSSSDWIFTIYGKNV